MYDLGIKNGTVYLIKNPTTYSYIVSKYNFLLYKNYKS